MNVPLLVVSKCYLGCHAFLPCQSEYQSKSPSSWLASPDRDRRIESLFRWKCARALPVTSLKSFMLDLWVSCSSSAISASCCRCRSQSALVFWLSIHGRKILRKPAKSPPTTPITGVTERMRTKTNHRTLKSGRKIPNRTGMLKIRRSREASLESCTSRFCDDR